MRSLKNCTENQPSSLWVKQPLENADVLHQSPENFELKITDAINFKLNDIYRIVMPETSVATRSVRCGCIYLDIRTAPAADEITTTLPFLFFNTGIARPLI